MKTAIIDTASSKKCLNSKHQSFLNEYLRCGDKLQAYQKVYPNAHGEAARVAATRLLARPEIAQQINQAQEQAHSTAVASLELSTTQHLQQEYASIAQKRAVLAKMISGQWKRKRYINLRHRVELVEEDISDHALLRAIALDTKLALQQEQLLKLEAKDQQTASTPTEGSIKKPDGMSDEEFAKRTIPFPAYGDKEAMRVWCTYHYGEGYYDKLLTGRRTAAEPFNKTVEKQQPTVKPNTIPFPKPQTIRQQQATVAPASSGIGRGKPIPTRNKT